VNAIQQEEATIRARGTITHVMQEKGEVPIAYMLNRGAYDKRLDKVHAGDAQIAAVAAPMTSRRTGSAWRNGCTARSIH